MSIRINMVRARSGDAFVVSVLSTPKPWLAVIDGGPPGIGTTRVIPVINKVIAETPGQAAAVDLMAVTHVDEDHIGGILEIVRAMRAGSLKFTIEAAWHNSFQALTGDEVVATDPMMRDRVSRFIETDGGIHDRESAGVVTASISQGVDLRDLLADLGLAGNWPVNGLLVKGMKPAVSGWPSIHVLGPSPEQIAALRRHWDREVNQQRNAFTAAAQAAAAIDQSVTNRSSLVFLLSHGGQRVLFTGDARSDDIVKSLQDEGLLDRREIHVDALKVPHHGSSRSCGVELFRTVIAHHYLISGDGRHGNPSLQMAKNLTDGLNGRAATVWMTYAAAEVTDHLARFPRITVRVAADTSDYQSIRL